MELRQRSSEELSREYRKPAEDISYELEKGMSGRYFYKLHVLAYWEPFDPDRLEFKPIQINALRSEVRKDIKDLKINPVGLTVCYIGMMIPLKDLLELKELKVSTKNRAKHQELRALHLADYETKRDAMKEYLKNRSERSARKLGDMSRAEYNWRRTFSESKKTRRSL